MGAERVCLLTETYYPVAGGGERQARSLAEGLVREGLRVIVLTRRSHRDLPRRQVLGGVELHRLPPVGRGPLKKWGLLLTSLVALVRLRRRYDVLLVCGYRILGLAAIGAGWIFRRPCVFKADSLGEMSGHFFRAGLSRFGVRLSSPVFRAALALRNQLLRRGDSFVAISSAVEEELIAHGIDGARIRRIPNSVDLDTFCPLDPADRAAQRRALGLPQSTPIVTYTGRLVSYKGLSLLLDVWRGIAKRHRAVLLIVGAGGLDLHNCEAQLRSFVAFHRLEASVRFTGQVEDVHAHLQASDIFVLPTEREAFGLSLVEAMACGLAVIATATGGIPDIIEHDRNGLLVEVGNGEELQRALEALLTDPDLVARLGRAARRSVEERYASAVVVRAYKNELGRVAAAAAMAAGGRSAPVERDG